MQQLKFSYKYGSSFVRSGELEALAPAVALAHTMLHEGSGPGGEMTGWLDLPVNYPGDELIRIKEAALKIRSDSEILIVIGIGGSYLGSRAVLEMLSHSFRNLLSREQRLTPRILFAGQNISSTYLRDLLDVVGELDFSLNVISKSGTTTEPAIAFRALKQLLESRYGKEEARQRIYLTTDGEGGILRELAASQGYTGFVIPKNVGGRYSVLTPVGLLPLAAAGIDVEELLKGAAAARDWYSGPEMGANPAYQYAALRNIFYRKGKTTEIMVSYEPALHSLGEWWKQLFAESEGKDQKGIFPAAVNFTTDLHSLGQFIQDGHRSIFATTLWISTPRREYLIPQGEGYGDGLDYLQGRALSFVNEQAFQGTLLAHTDGGVPNLVLEIPTLNPFYCGALIYFFEKACAISGYLLGVNPFDQPGVEDYKKNMFALLGKAGFEDRQKELGERLK